MTDYNDVNHLYIDHFHILKHGDAGMIEQFLVV